MKWRLHLIGASLSVLLVILGADIPSAPAVQAQTPTTVQELRSKLGEVRRDRREIDEEWEETIEKLAAQLATPPAAVRQPRSVRSIAYTRMMALPRRPFAGAGIWSAAAEKARVERRAWIDAKLAELQAKHRKDQ